MRKPGVCAIVAASALLAFSCLSNPMDKMVMDSLSPEQKSQILSDRGIGIYNRELVGKGDLSVSSQLRELFSSALKIYPDNKQAAAYLKKIDDYKKDKMDAYLSRAKALVDKKGRSDKEDYELVLSVQRAGELDPSTKELGKLKSDTADLRKNLMRKRVEALNASRKSLAADKNAAANDKLLTQLAKQASELKVLDPGNKDAAEAQKAIKAIADNKTKSLIDAAKASLAKKDYAGAKASGDKAAKALSQYGEGQNAELKALRYQIAFQWSKDQLAKKKYDLADQLADQALALNRSQEAQSLKADIAKAKSTRDYDAEIEDLAATIDGNIKAGQLLDAWNMIGDGVDKLKVQANKDRISSYRNQIRDRLKAIYTDAVNDYNAEDYESARDNLAIVLAITPDYEQAKAYYDKATNKLKALGGN